MNQQTALVFDDSALFRILLTKILRSKQIKATAFVDPSYYLHMICSGKCSCESSCYDYILTDNQMPEMSGFELLERLNEIGCKVPAHRKAIFSANWVAEDLEKAQQLGCRVFHKSELHSEVMAWIDE